MDVFDSLALWGRRLEPQRVPSTGSTRFSLVDLLQLFDRTSILELTPVRDKQTLPTVKPDSVRKVKVSLLDDGISAVHSDAGDWYEVFRTAPSGDLSRVRIVAHSSRGDVLGEVRMLAGRRTYDHYFAEDPIFEHIERLRG